MKIKLLLIIIIILSSCDSGIGTIQQKNNNNDTGNDPQVADLGSTSTNRDLGPKNRDLGKDSQADDGEPDLGEMDSADMKSVPIQVRVVIGENSGKLSSWSFNQNTREFLALDSDNSANSISWVAKHPLENVFYTTSGSALRAYTIKEDGTIAFTSQSPLSADGTHVDIDKKGKWAIVASYGGGSVEILPLKNGQPGEVLQTLDAASFCKRAHQIRISPDNKHVYVPCLGNDYVRALDFDDNSGALTMTQPGNTPNGSGPRHLDFHPNADFIYVLNESSSSITRFSSQTGALLNPQTTSTLPAGRDMGSASSDIHISADGKFLYAVNRQPLHQIAVFKIEDKGRLTLVEHVPGKGLHSRSFAISPDGKSLLLGNTNSNNLIIFQRDTESGKLIFEKTVDLESGPMFVGFL